MPWEGFVPTVRPFRPQGRFLHHLSICASLRGVFIHTMCLTAAAVSDSSCYGKHFVLTMWKFIPTTQPFAHTMSARHSTDLASSCSCLGDDLQWPRLSLNLTSGCFSRTVFIVSCQLRRSFLPNHFEPTLRTILITLCKFVKPLWVFFFLTNVSICLHLKDVLFTLCTNLDEPRKRFLPMVCPFIFMAWVTCLWVTTTFL